MKGYAIMLSVLFVAVLLDNGRLLFAGQTPLFQLMYLLEIIAFGLCLTGALARAFNRTIFTADIWRTVWYSTLALGIAVIGLKAFGSYWGFAPAGTKINILGLGMTALRFGLFAVPVMLYEQMLRGEGES